MEENYRDDYRDSYRDYRDDYRNNHDSYRDYRDNYRDEYGRNQRDEYGRNQRDRYGRNRRSYRNYRSQEDYYACLEDLVEDGMELARAYEDAGEMATNSKEKSMLMKLGEKEKEHYRMVKEMVEKGM